MPIETPPATLRTLALECVRRVTHDLTSAHFPAGMNGSTDDTRYKAVITWAVMGQEIARGEWSDRRLFEFVQDCQAQFQTCEDITALP